MSLSEEDKQILIYFSLLHDIGRDPEDEDDTHGDKSVELIRKKNIRIRGIQLSKKGYRIAKLLIRHHLLNGLEALLMSIQTSSIP